MTFLEELAGFVVQAQATDLPRLDRDILRRHMCDVVVARIAGEATTEGRELLKVFPRESRAEAIAAAAGLVRLTEMDDIHIESTTTPSSVTVPVALGLAAQGESFPADLESAIYVGTELVVRFGLAMDGSRSLMKGVWPTRAAAALGACASASRMLGLSRGQAHEALSLALTMSSGRGGPFVQSPSGRWVLFAQAVETGLRAALAGRAGFNGGPRPPSPEWISGTLGVPFTAEMMTRDLGKGSLFPELSLKPYATSRQTLSAADAMLGLMADGLRVETVRSLSIRIPSAHLGLVSAPFDPAIRSRNFMSIGTQVAIAAIRPEQLYNAEREKVVHDPDVMAFAAKCSVIGDDDLDKVFPNVWGARLDLDTEAGLLSRTVLHPYGSPENRMDDRQVLEKARAVLSHGGQVKSAEEIMSCGATAFTDQTFARRLGDLLLGG